MRSGARAGVAIGVLAAIGGSLTYHHVRLEQHAIERRADFRRHQRSTDHALQAFLRTIQILESFEARLSRIEDSL